jgi:hypothetical protein
MIDNKTPEQLRQEAKTLRSQAEESFQRCDTDGFLSQWALGLAAREREDQAIIAENGGMSEFVGLYEGDRRVAARLIDTAYGTCWLLHDVEEAHFGRRFIPFNESSRIQKKLGLKERSEMAPARAKIVGTGRGLSGNAWVATVRIGDKWGLDAKLV